MNDQAPPQRRIGTRKIGIKRGRNLELLGQRQRNLIGREHPGFDEPSPKSHTLRLLLR